MKIDGLVPLESLLKQHEQERALRAKLIIDALDLLVELWPQPGTGEGVYLTADQWARLRQLLLSVPELGD
jgi:hypothetical protein